MSLLERDITKKRRIYNNATELEVDDDEDGEYKVEAICNSVIYARESTGHLPGLYYLVS